jgi:predicted DNA-binding antitoxin AbrB/MazE fold protein
MIIPAKYENGLFRPLAAAEFKEGTIVDVYVPHQEKAKPHSIRNLGSLACGPTAMTSRMA